MKLSLEKRHLDLKVNWKLSRNQTTFKENFILTLKSPLGDLLSEVAPNIRYGETPQKIEEQFQSWPYENVNDLKSLQETLDIKPLFHSLRFALESVFLKYFALHEKKSLSDFLGLPPIKVVETSFSMPIIPIAEIKDYLAPLSRFKSLKIKVNAETGMEMLQEIKKYTDVKLRVDGNEAWSDFDAFMGFQESLHGMNIELIEQPFPSSMTDEYKELKKKTPYVLLADESIEDVGDFSELSKQFHAINVKLMKTGSLLKARDLLFEAKKQGMKSMIGCMIETSVGISYGMLFSGMADYIDLDGFLLVKDEPFKYVTESNGCLKISP